MTSENQEAQLEEFRAATRYLMFQMEKNVKLGHCLFGTQCYYNFIAAYAHSAGIIIPDTIEPTLMPTQDLIQLLTDKKGK